MVFARSACLLAIALCTAGCGYVHFGRLPAAPIGDARVAEAYSNLTTEQKILRQELALARKEGDALRAALERAGASASVTDLNARLTDTARELAALRVSHAKLQAERASATGAEPAGNKAQLSAVEDQLAAALRNSTQLQEENARLRRDLERTQTENASLGTQLQTAVARHEQAQSALAQLNTELLAQKEARTRAEQAAAAMHAQLGVVMAARGAGATPPTPGASASDAGAAGASALRSAKATPVDAAAELRVDLAQLRAKSEPPAKPARTHVVEVGDTLERLAQKYYGSGERWTRIYSANQTLLANGRPLTAGMELTIPE